jgi:hypothetical protein
MKEKIQNIILTVQSAGKNKLRLGIGVHDSRNLFKCRGVQVTIKINGLNDINCVTTCGNPCDKNGLWIKFNPKTKKPYRKKGYDLYNAKLSKWLLGHSEIKLSKERSKRLEFEVEKSIDGFILRYLRFKPKPAHNKT